MDKWLLVDGFNLAYRSFHAVPELSRADGFPTNALHGWIKTIWRLLDQHHPNACVVFFDLGGAQDRSRSCSNSARTRFNRNVAHRSGHLGNGSTCSARRSAVCAFVA